MLLAAEGKPCELGGATVKFEVSSNYRIKEAYTKWIIADFSEMVREVCITDCPSLIRLLLHK